MSAITTVPAQVGNGKAVHYVRKDAFPTCYCDVFPEPHEVLPEIVSSRCWRGPGVRR
ncbi:hypothetical protein QF035_008878 [Streptomyces umbrinus]|uniref:Uncharacterized protein n=1 Tax=Streptomyces umbrinus TaxID=67370 RepID=A0ABU0T678_9ACTN|nr:hypothetical protein [Streptomyces umbrinus]